MIKLYHYDDPKATTILHFVYLHGKAEELGEQHSTGSAGDLCGTDTPIALVDGVYEIDLYGEPGIMVIDRGRITGHSSGRVALLSDNEFNLNHVKTPQDWR